MQVKVTLMLGGLALAGLGCSGRPELVQTESTQDQLRVIVHLETRNEVTSVLSGRDVRAYTIRAKNGGTLGERLSEHELWTKFPAIHRLLKTSCASNEGVSASWAGGNL